MKKSMFSHFWQCWPIQHNDELDGSAYFEVP